MNEVKLKNIFTRELNKIDEWQPYLKYIGCKILSHEETYPYGVDLICINYVRENQWVRRIGHRGFYRIGIPYELAEKALVLDGLPPSVAVSPRLTTEGVEWVAA